MKHIASCSFGKDSVATVLLALEHGEPLDEAVYCEVMFDKDISGEVPEHRDFIYTRGIPALERMGVKVTVLRGEKTYAILLSSTILLSPSEHIRIVLPGSIFRSKKSISTVLSAPSALVMIFLSG